MPKNISAASFGKSVLAGKTAGGIRFTCPFLCLFLLDKQKKEGETETEAKERREIIFAEAKERREQAKERGR